MLKVLRYALATICFAASVGCLALWGWSATHREQRFKAIYYTKTMSVSTDVIGGVTYAGMGRAYRAGPNFTKRLELKARKLRGLSLQFYPAYIRAYGYFGAGRRSVHFPLWYPALIFALAGVAALRFSRRFTLRSAIIATTVVAGLLGMAVGL